MGHGNCGPIQSGGKVVKAYRSGCHRMRNTFSHNGREWAWGARSNRMLLEGNTITYNNVEHYAQKTWGAAGIKFIWLTS